MKLLTVLNTVIASLALIVLSACGGTTPENADYIYDFHKQYSPTHQHPLVPDSAVLYVDYTKATEMRARIKFYWEVMRPTLADKMEKYYAIKGQEIKREAGDIPELLSAVKNYENPDLKGALDRIVNGNTEAVLITDGELADPVSPFMKDAFKTWLLKGHDIYILAEPYYENGKVSAKKLLFFFIFYDAKMDKNLFEYIKRVGRLSHYPKIHKMNLSITPSVKGTHGGHSDPNSYVQAMVTRKGDMELQEWSTGWNDKIEKFIIQGKEGGKKDQDNGAVLIDGLQLDKNSIAGIRINNVAMKVFNINGDYADYYDARKAEEEIEPTIDWSDVSNFMVLDQKSFDRNGFMKVYFDKKNYNDSCLDGAPFNYFKIAFFISELHENMERFRPMLEFDDRFKEGFKNVSVFESVKQTISDPEITDFMANNPFYSIYVKAQQK
ncbi:MAG: hypothetical protein IJ607_11375 [Bacteroidaceae bacterium]|nr:hypothetical protein [Bacteroidaceae bacterium]